MTLQPHLVCMPSGHTLQYMRYPSGRVGASQCRTGVTVTPSLIFSLSGYWHTDIYMCPVKWIYGLYYLFAAKLILKKWPSFSKRFWNKNPCRLKVTEIIQAQTDKKVPELILLLLGQVLYQPLCRVISLTL